MKLLHLILFAGVLLQISAALSIPSQQSIVGDHHDDDDDDDDDHKHKDHKQEQKDVDLMKRTDDLIGRAEIVLKYLPEADLKREIQIINQNLKFLKYMFQDPESRDEKDKLRHDIEEADKEFEPILAEAERWIKRLPTTTSTTTTPEPSTTTTELCTSTPYPPTTTTEQPINDDDQRLIQKVRRLIQDGYQNLIKFRMEENYFSYALRNELMRLEQSFDNFQRELKNPYQMVMLYREFVPMARQKLRRSVRKLADITEMGRSYGTEEDYESFLKLLDLFIQRSYSFCGYLYMRGMEKEADSIKNEIMLFKESMKGLKHIDRHRTPELAADRVAKILRQLDEMIGKIFQIDQDVGFDRVAALKTKIPIGDPVNPQ